jgi:hypothetical protein
MGILSGMIVDNKIPVYSFEWLCQKMQDRGRVAIVLHDPQGAIIRGIINGIRPEDGSGRHWLVTIFDSSVTPGVTNEVYVRTG